MKLVLISLNLIAAALVFPAMSLLHRVNVVTATTMYVQLDRAGVIDRNKLKDQFPLEAENDRLAIPKRYIDSEHNEWIVGGPCIAGFLLNALLIGIFMKSTSAAEQARGAERRTSSGG